ncbi:Embryo-specific ATS3 [Dillenia turbinata]|uniref:Embryo-specific ATS3 n=1 Tax=Dillenia turbinata TaxID=194707 RepID=A0AAN8YW43_9MAGN
MPPSYKDHFAVSSWEVHYIYHQARLTGLHLFAEETFFAKMIRLLLILLFSSLLLVFSQSNPITPQPHKHELFPIKTKQNAGVCSYHVTIMTSCSSVPYTYDEISLAFGDRYGNQVLVYRIDNPPKTFERCSTDTFRIRGPCTHQICYVALYRHGRDGWKPKSITISRHDSEATTFFYDRFLRDDIWERFDRCL